MARKQKKQVIDSDEEALKNASIKLELDEELKKLISNRDDLLDREEAINVGFSTPQTTYSTLVFDSQITYRSPVKLKNQGLKCLAEDSLVLNQVYSLSRKSIYAHLLKKDASIQILQEL